MRLFLAASLFFLGLCAADDLVTKGRIKVQLFAAPAFVSEVSVDAYDKLCVSLDNNLYLTTHPPFPDPHGVLTHMSGSTAACSPF
jgi:hypothetical protein